MNKVVKATRKSTPYESAKDRIQRRICGYRLEKAAEPSSTPVEDYDPVTLATVQKFNNEIANKDKDPCP